MYRNGVLPPEAKAGRRRYRVGTIRVQRRVFLNPNLDQISNFENCICIDSLIKSKINNKRKKIQVNIFGSMVTVLRYYIFFYFLRKNPSFYGEIGLLPPAKCIRKHKKLILSSAKNAWKEKCTVRFLQSLRLQKYYK